MLNFYQFCVSQFSEIFFKIAGNVWVFLLAGIIITGFCKYNEKNKYQKFL